jgi:hypothetical protein
MIRKNADNERVNAHTSRSSGSRPDGTRGPSARIRRRCCVSGSTPGSQTSPHSVRNRRSASRPIWPS